MQPRCAGHPDPELWFGQNWRGAKIECGKCPLRDACLQAALDFETTDYLRRLAEDGRTGSPQCDGVWGGRTAVERKRMIEHRVHKQGLIAA